MHSAYASKERKALTLFLEGALKILCVMDWVSYYIYLMN